MQCDYEEVIGYHQQTLKWVVATKEVLEDSVRITMESVSRGPSAKLICADRNSTLQTFFTKHVVCCSPACCHNAETKSVLKNTG